MLHFRRILYGLLICTAFFAMPVPAQVALVADRDLEGPALHGLRKLEQALVSKGYMVYQPEEVLSTGAAYIILAGKSPGEGPAAKVLRAGGISMPGGPEAPEHDRRWIGLLVLGSVPTALIGLALRDPVEAMHERVVWVGGALLVTAILLAVSERLGRRDRGAESLAWTDALWIGAVQGLAVIPGISRSGSTVAAALVRDVDGETSVEFSMLLSVPAILGASLLEFVRADRAELVAGIAPLVIGFATAFAIGIAALKVLQWIVVRRKLMPFAVYCAILGVGVIALG